MAFRPNYSQQRGDRERAKEQKKQARLRRRTEDSDRRKAERESLPGSDTAPDAPPGDTTGEDT